MVEVRRALDTRDPWCSQLAYITSCLHWKETRGSPKSKRSTCGSITSLIPSQLQSFLQSISPIDFRPGWMRRKAQSVKVSWPGLEMRSSFPYIYPSLICLTCQLFVCPKYSNSFLYFLGWRIYIVSFIMILFASKIFALSFLAQGLAAQQIVNGQIYTPGIAIIDAPQPNTPLGGGTTSFILYLNCAYLSRLLTGRSRCILRRPASITSLSG